MPKNFIYFLAIAQIILACGHWLLYAALIFFFPELLAYHTFLLAVVLLFAISFLILTLVSFKKENAFLRAAYIISSIEIITWFYLLCSAAVASLVYLAFRGVNLPAIRYPIFGAAILFSMYGILNARLLKLTTVRVSLPNLPEYWKGKTAVLVSDLHLGHVLRKGFAKKIVAKMNALNPDIVFIPGDLYDSVKMDFQAMADVFKNVRAPLGMYYASGNHELYAGMRECEQALRQAGVHVLDDGLLNVEGLQIAGIGYDHEHMPDLADRLRKLDIKKNQPSILLKHVPLQLKEAALAGISLQLSGHTHVGQVWPGPLITKRYFKGYDYGLKHFENMLVYVSSGAGTWGPPMRSGSRSEIVQIIFE